MTTTTFPASKVKSLRRRAQNAGNAADDGPEGWSISSVDPMNVLAVFSPLRIKEGFVLRAYQFREGGNGNGFVYALPTDAEFPDPANCPRLPDRFLNPPTPPAALDDVMEVIEGDDSPWSYFCASLLFRELGEFGAMWHGCNWSTHRIVGENPWNSPRPKKKSLIDGPSGSPEDWEWEKPQPKRWGPQVREDEDRIEVVFYTYSGFGCEAIYRHVDTFTRGNYRFKSRREIVAKGGGGYVC